jgi:hypothetical protein
VDHLGIQVEDGLELQEVYQRLKRAEGQKGVLSRRARRFVAMRKARKAGSRILKESNGRHF